MKYVIHWRSSITNYHGQGEPLASKAVAEACLKDAAAKYPYCHYWIEEVEG